MVHSRDKAIRETRHMKFNFFHSMPWTHYEGVPESWPVSSGNFDGPRGKALYDDYIESMVHAESCDFDWIACIT